MDTLEQYAKAFNEWARRYAENPEEFTDCIDANGNVIDDYGTSCATYFQKILNEVTK